VGWSIVNGVLSLIYNGMLDGSPKGQTVGKMAVGIQTRDEATGEALDIGRGYVRAVVPLALGLVNQFSPALGIVAILDDLWPLWDPRKQSWHDKAAGSIVVKVPPAV